MNKLSTYNLIFTCAFDGDEAPAEGASNAPAYTQAQVESMLADASKTAADEVRKANASELSNLQMLQTRAKLSEKEKADLTSQIKDLEGKVFSAEELASRDRAKLTDQYEGQVKSLTSERDSWQTRFADSTISTSITDAAVKNDAFSPSQISAFLRPKTKLVEQADEDGNITGYNPIVTLPSKDKKGNTVKLELSPLKAVEVMKEDPEHFNLFKGKTKGGMGSNTGGAGKDTSLADLAKDPEAYAKHRAEQRKNRR